MQWAPWNNLSCGGLFFKIMGHVCNDLKARADLAAMEAKAFSGFRSACPVVRRTVAVSFVLLQWVPDINYFREGLCLAHDFRFNPSWWGRCGIKPFVRPELLRPVARNALMDTTPWACSMTLLSIPSHDQVDGQDEPQQRSFLSDHEHTCNSDLLYLHFVLLSGPSCPPIISSQSRVDQHSAKDDLWRSSFLLCLWLTSPVTAPSSRLNNTSALFGPLSTSRPVTILRCV